jgi:gas vesicle protein
LLKKISKSITSLKINTMSAQRVLVAGLTGFVAGVVVGLMVAPASGSEIRQHISDSANDLAGGIKDKIRNLRGKAEEELDDVNLNIPGDNS